MAKRKKKYDILPGRTRDDKKAIDTYATGTFKTKVAKGDEGIGVSAPGRRPVFISSADARANATYKKGSAERAAGDAIDERKRRLQGVGNMPGSGALGQSESGIVRAVGAVPGYLKAAVGAIEDLTAGDTAKAKTARKTAKQQQGKLRYKRKVEQIKTGGALTTRPGIQDTGMDSGTGATVHIPDNWDLDAYREMVHELRMSGAGGASGGRMSVQEAHRKAAEVFRRVYGDERNWDKQGMTRDRYGAPITTALATKSKRRAIAGETARITGRSVQKPGELGYMLPDATAIAQRKLLDAMDDAAKSKSPAKQLDAKERLQAFDARGMYFPDSDDPPGKESERTLSKIDAIKKNADKGTITVKEARDLMKPLIDQIANNVGRKAARKADEERKAAAAVESVEKVKRTTAVQDAETDEAKTMYDRAVSDVTEANTRMKDLREAIKDAKDDIIPENGDEPEQIELASHLATMTEELDELRKNMPAIRAGVKTSRDAWDAERQKSRGLLKPQDGSSAAPATADGAGDLIPGVTGESVEAAAPAGDPITPAADAAEGDGTDGAGNLRLEPGTLLRGIVPGVSMEEMGYDGMDGKANPVVKVMYSDSQDTQLRFTNPDGTTIDWTVPTAKLAEYYGPADTVPPAMIKSIEANITNGKPMTAEMADAYFRLPEEERTRLRILAQKGQK